MQTDHLKTHEILSGRTSRPPLPIGGRRTLNYLDLALASILVLIDAGLSIIFGLKIHRSLLVAFSDCRFSAACVFRKAATRLIMARNSSTFLTLGSRRNSGLMLQRQQRLVYRLRPDFGDDRLQGLNARG
jgi:hypothetical protein